jgi:hypothetical protein
MTESNYILSELNKQATLIEVAMGLKLIELKREASGSLIKSLSHNITDRGDYSFDIDIMALSYWYYVNYGVMGSNIPYEVNRRSGAKNSQYIDGLINWLKIKGVSSDNDVIKGIAFAIAYNQTSKGGLGKGNPINKSKLGFVEKTKAQRDIHIQDMANGFQSEVVALMKNNLVGELTIFI